MTVTRNSRFAPAAEGLRRRRLTGNQNDALRWIVEYRFLTTSQLAALLDKSLDATRKHTRVLKDAKYVRSVGVDREHLDPTLKDSKKRIEGSSEDFLLPTSEGVQYLTEIDYISDEAKNRSVTRFGWGNSAMLAHESMMHQMHVWLECAKKTIPDSTITAWREGRSECLFTIPTTGEDIIPDAWFTFDYGDGTRAVGMVEADRGTDNNQGWEQKIYRYVELFASPLVKELTGKTKARVYALTPDEARVTVINRIIRGVLKDSSGWDDWFVVAPWRELTTKKITDAIWKLPNNTRIPFGS